MRLWVKGSLFLSAYSPLFLIIAIRYYPNNFALLILGIVLLLGILSWGGILYIAKRSTQEHFTIVSYEDRAKDALNYIIPYVISFIGFNFCVVADLAAFGILMLIIFIVYVESSLIYVNPLLSLFGRRMLSVQVYRRSTGNPDLPEELLVLARKKYFRKGDPLRVKMITEDFAMVE